MAEGLEDTSLDNCVDRTNDANSFLNNQFDIFVHDYREYSEGGAACGCDEGFEDGECSSAHESGPSKKHLVNITRRLQKAVFSLKSLPNSTAFSDLISQLEGLYIVLSRSLAGEKAEFTPSNVPLPEYDEADMQMLLGDDDVPRQKGMLDHLKEEKKKGEERLEGLLVQADILLREVAHAKGGLPK